MIKFEKAKIEHKDTLYQWLDEPHVKEFWDNSQEHKEDISNFMNGRKTPSSYFNGVFDYWIGSCPKDKGWVPFCLIMTSPFEGWTGRSLSRSGNTITIDFVIGNMDYLGKGLASKAILSFMDFYRSSVDSEVDRFFIDPNEGNARAIHVYLKAGFRKRGKYKVKEGFFHGNTNLIMIKTFSK